MLKKVYCFDIGYVPEGSLHVMISYKLSRRDSIDEVGIVFVVLS